MDDSPSPPRRDAGNWHRLFERAREPIFLLNQQRRLLHANRAWEELLQFRSAEVRGLVCSPRRSPETGPLATLAQALAPPPEVFAGRPARVRRLTLGSNQLRQWWDVDFLPFHDHKGRLRILGKIELTPAPETSDTPLLPDMLAALRERLDQRYGLEPLADQRPPYRRLAEQIRLASQHRFPVLLTGEPGTGKEWTARVIHHQGNSRLLSFATVDCAALPPTAQAVALLGDGGLLHNRGMGTVYLRAITALPRELQDRLAEWLQVPDPTGPRLIAGCDVDPDEAVRTDHLLENLYCALSTLVIGLLPLRERQEDLSWLVEQFLVRANGDGERSIRGLAAPAWEIVRAYNWPGNLRELWAVLTGARLRAKTEQIEAADLPLPLRLAVNLEQRPGPPAPRTLSLKQLLEQVERRLLELALREAQGNKSKAAEFLGVWRTSLIGRLEKLGITDR